jgi:hypothetical protein
VPIPSAVPAARSDGAPIDDLAVVGPPASSSPLIQRFAGVAIFGASFALAAYVVANKSGVHDLLAAVGPLRVPLAIVIFAIVASAPFSVTADKSDRSAGFSERNEIFTQQSDADRGTVGLGLFR